VHTSGQSRPRGCGGAVATPVSLLWACVPKHISECQFGVTELTDALPTDPDWCKTDGKTSLGDKVDNLLMDCEDSKPLTHLLDQLKLPWEQRHPVHKMGLFFTHTHSPVHLQLE
jgi:hypothetical protein